MPKVSVCIPTYNYGRYIIQAIESAQCQTFGDHEILVIDDRSEDDTAEIVAGLMRKDRRLRFLQNERRLGFAGNFSRCIELAAGEYVKILCADDLLEPACLERMTRALDELPAASLVASRRLLIDGNGKHVGESSYADGSLLEQGSLTARRCFFSVDNRIGEPTAVMFRKKQALRGFKGEYSLLVDLEMWLHLLAQGDFVFLAEPLCRVRRHEGQATWGCARSLDFANDLVRLHRDYGEKPYFPFTRTDLWKWRLGAAFNIWEKRRYFADRSALRKHLGWFLDPRLAAIVMPFYGRMLQWKHGAVHGSGSIRKEQAW